MSYAYISYSYRDTKVANLLVDALQKAGVKVWYDVNEIKPGVDWGTATEQALNDSDAVIFLATGDSIRLGYIQTDLKRAVSLDKPVLPLILSEGGARYLPDYLRKYPVYDVRGAEDDDVVKVLLGALPASVLQDKPVIPQAPKSKGYVFISYAEEDTDFVMHLRDFLRERGYGYWDYQDSDRNYHTQLFNELEDVIRGAAATLSVLSPDWKKSQWAAKEYLFSEEVGTPVFLLMARDIGPTLVTAGIAYINFERDVEQGFAKLDRELRRKGLIE